MALNSLFCADVPLSNYSLTSNCQNTSGFFTAPCRYGSKIKWHKSSTHCWTRSSALANWPFYAAKHFETGRPKK